MSGNRSHAKTIIYSAYMTIRKPKNELTSRCYIISRFPFGRSQKLFSLPTIWSFGRCFLFMRWKARKATHVIYYLFKSLQNFVYKISVSFDPNNEVDGFPNYFNVWILPRLWRSKSILLEEKMNRSKKEIWKTWGRIWNRTRVFKHVI